MSPRFNLRRLVFWIPLILPLYVVRFSIGPLPTTLLEIILLLALVSVTLTNGVSIWKKGFERTKVWHLPALLWLVTTTAAVFVAPHHIAALGLWRAYVAEPMLFALMLAGMMETDEDRKDIEFALVGSIIWVALYALGQYLSGRGIPHPWDTSFLTRRATGPFPYPNALSLYCAPIAAYCIGRLVTNREDAYPSMGRMACAPTSDDRATKRKRTKILVIGFALGLLGILLAKSDGGFAGLLAATVVALVWQKKTRNATIAAVVIGLCVIAAVPKIRTPIVKAITFQEWSGHVRLLIWDESVAMLKDHPIFGAGFGAYPDVIKPYHKATYIEIFQYPHDILLNLWSETGLLGILAFVWLCWTWARLTLKRDGDARRLVFLFPLIAILVQGLVDVPYFKNDLAVVFWLFVILIPVA